MRADTNTPIHPWLVPTGRFLLASLFILGGINKVLNYTATQAGMTEAGLPLAAVLLPLTILLELGGGLMVAFGLPFHRWVALLLAGFTVLVNVIFHPFWLFGDSDGLVQLSLFFKNVAVTGGLLLVAGMPERTR